MNFKEFETEQKLRGGYYTPNVLTRFIIKWILEKKPKTILEPSCGDGAFIKSLAEANNNKTNLNVTGFEIIEEEVKKSKKLINNYGFNNSKIIHADFLKWTLNKLNSKIEFDAVIGNPPFIRYQYLSEETQNHIEMIFKLLNLKFTKHTNLWVPFILASINFLKPGGRLGMIVPAEILHIMHAQSLRTYLGTKCNKILIFDPEDIWFRDTLQGAVILFAEKKMRPKDTSKGLAIIRTKGYNFTKSNPTKLFSKTNYINGKTVQGKWTYALLSSKEFELLQKLGDLNNVHLFKEIASVDVGIVTGANNFFLVNDEIVKKYDLNKFSYPMFGRSEHCPGIIYDKKQHRVNIIKGLPTNFLWFNVDSESELNESQLQYIKNGERNKLDSRYKCRIRTPWFKVPSVYATKVGMLKRAHDFPRLILNNINAYTTDTAYRIKTNGIEDKILVFCFINSLTALTAELEGRHYGGGVLELVPSEIEKLLIPLPEGIKSQINLNRINDSFLNGGNQIEIMVKQDSTILKRIGLTNNEVDSLQNAWLRLKDRRQRIAK